MMSRLKDECHSVAGVLEQVRYRADWLRYQEMQKRKEEQALEKERGKKKRLLILEFNNCRIKFDYP